MFAASQGRVDIAQLLIAGKADVNARCETVTHSQLLPCCMCAACMLFA